MPWMFRMISGTSAAFVMLQRPLPVIIILRPGRFIFSSRVTAAPFSAARIAAITIHEGRNRQVRRMFAAVGCDVKSLKRVRFADLTLKGVARGHHRALTQEEVSKLYRLAGLTR